MRPARLILIAAWLACGARGAAAEDRDQMARICVDRMIEAVGREDAIVVITQERVTESGDLNLTLRAAHRVAHCTVHPDHTLAGFDLMN